jgi:hypothetical protein
MQSMIPYKVRKENVKAQIENKIQQQFRTPNFLDETVLTEADHEFIRKEILLLPNPILDEVGIYRSKIYDQFTAYCYEKMYRIYLDVKKSRNEEPGNELEVKNRFRRIYENEYNYYLESINLPYRISSVAYQSYSSGAAYTLCIAIKLGMLDICRKLFDGRSF